MEEHKVGNYIDLSFQFKPKSYIERQQEIEELKSLRKSEINEGIKKPNRFYVYAYMNPKIKGPFIFESFIFEYAPFYIGKGTGDRLYSHLYYSKKIAQSNLKFHVIDKIKEQTNRLPIIVKLVDNVTEDIAFDVENLLIRKIGRICNSTGILTNKQNGHKDDWKD